MLKIKIIQTQIKLTLPYPYKGQFYEDTQIEYCSTVIHTNKYNYVWQCGLGAFLNITQGSAIDCKGQEVSYK